MYNRLYEHFAMNNILYEKEIDFQEGHSTEHAVIKLTDQINSSFEKNLLKLGIYRPCKSFWHYWLSSFNFQITKLWG